MLLLQITHDFLCSTLSTFECIETVLKAAHYLVVPSMILLMHLLFRDLNREVSEGGDSNGNGGLPIGGAGEPNTRERKNNNGSNSGYHISLPNSIISRDRVLRPRGG